MTSVFLIESGEYRLSKVSAVYDVSRGEQMELTLAQLGSGEEVGSYPLLAIAMEHVQRVKAEQERGAKPSPPSFPVHPLTATCSSAGFVFAIPVLPLFALLTSRPSLLRHVVTDVLVHHAVHLKRFQSSERFKRAQAEQSGNGDADALHDVEQLHGSGQLRNPHLKRPFHPQQHRRGHQPQPTGVQWEGELAAAVGGVLSEAEMARKEKEERRERRREAREAQEERRRAVQWNELEGHGNHRTVEQRKFAVQAQQLWQAGKASQTAKEAGEEEGRRRWQVAAALSHADVEDEEGMQTAAMDHWLEERQKKLAAREQLQQPIIPSAPAHSTAVQAQPVPAPLSHPSGTAAADVRPTDAAEGQEDVMVAFPSISVELSAAEQLHQLLTPREGAIGVARPSAGQFMQSTIALIHRIAKENHLTHIVHPKAQLRLRGRRGDKAAPAVKWTEEGRHEETHAVEADAHELEEEEEALRAKRSFHSHSHSSSSSSSTYYHRRGRSHSKRMSFKPAEEQRERDGQPTGAEHTESDQGRKEAATDGSSAVAQGDVNSRPDTGNGVEDEDFFQSSHSLRHSSLVYSPDSAQPFFPTLPDGSINPRLIHSIEKGLDVFRLDDVSGQSDSTLLLEGGPFLLSHPTCSVNEAAAVREEDEAASSSGTASDDSQMAGEMARALSKGSLSLYRKSLAGAQGDQAQFRAMREKRQWEKQTALDRGARARGSVNPQTSNSRHAPSFLLTDDAHLGQSGASQSSSLLMDDPLALAALLTDQSTGDKLMGPSASHAHLQASIAAGAAQREEERKGAERLSVREYLDELYERFGLSGAREVVDLMVREKIGVEGQSAVDYAMATHGLLSSKVQRALLEAVVAVEAEMNRVDELKGGWKRAAVEEKEGRAERLQRRQRKKERKAERAEEKRLQLQQMEERITREVQQQLDGNVGNTEPGSTAGAAAEPRETTPLPAEGEAPLNSGRVLLPSTARGQVDDITSDSELSDSSDSASEQEREREERAQREAVPSVPRPIVVANALQLEAQRPPELATPQAKPKPLTILSPSSASPSPQPKSPASLSTASILSSPAQPLQSPLKAAPTPVRPASDASSRASSRPSTPRTATSASGTSPDADSPESTPGPSSPVRTQTAPDRFISSPQTGDEASEQEGGEEEVAESKETVEALSAVVSAAATPRAVPQAQGGVVGLKAQLLPRVVPSPRSVLPLVSPSRSSRVPASVTQQITVPATEVVSESPTPKASPRPREAVVVAETVKSAMEKWTPSSPSRPPVESAFLLGADVGEIRKVVQKNIAEETVQLEAVKAVEEEQRAEAELREHKKRDKEEKARQKEREEEERRRAEEEAEEEAEDERQRAEAEEEERLQREAELREQQEDLAAFHANRPPTHEPLDTAAPKPQPTPAKAKAKEVKPPPKKSKKAETAAPKEEAKEAKTPPKEAVKKKGGATALAAGKQKKHPSAALQTPAAPPPPASAPSVVRSSTPLFPEQLTQETKPSKKKEDTAHRAAEKETEKEVEEEDSEGSEAAEEEEERRGSVQSEASKAEVEEKDDAAPSLKARIVDGLTRLFGDEVRHQLIRKATEAALTAIEAKKAAKRAEATNAAAKAKLDRPLSTVTQSPAAHPKEESKVEELLSPHQEEAVNAAALLQVHEMEEKRRAEDERRRLRAEGRAHEEERLAEERRLNREARDRRKEEKMRRRITRQMQQLQNEAAKEAFSRLASPKAIKSSSHKLTTWDATPSASTLTSPTHRILSPRPLPSHRMGPKDDSRVDESKEQLTSSSPPPEAGLDEDASAAPTSRQPRTSRKKRRGKSRDGRHRRNSSSSPSATSRGRHTGSATDDLYFPEIPSSVDSLVMRLRQETDWSAFNPSSGKVTRIAPSNSKALDDFDCTVLIEDELARYTDVIMTAASGGLLPKNWFTYQYMQSAALLQRQLHTEDGSSDEADAVMGVFEFEETEESRAARLKAALQAEEAEKELMEDTEIKLAIERRGSLQAYETRMKELDARKHSAARRQRISEESQLKEQRLKEAEQAALQARYRLEGEAATAAAYSEQQSLDQLLSTSTLSTSAPAGPTEGENPMAEAEAAALLAAAQSRLQLQSIPYAVRDAMEVAEAERQRLEMDRSVAEVLTDTAGAHEWAPTSTAPASFLPVIHPSSPAAGSGSRRSPRVLSSPQAKAAGMAGVFAATVTGAEAVVANPMLGASRPRYGERRVSASSVLKAEGVIAAAGLGSGSLLASLPNLTRTAPIGQSPFASQGDGRDRRGR